MQTIRQALVALLSGEPLCARELSQTLGIREKEVYEHLVHIERTAVARHQKLLTLPFACLDCGFVFRNRKRFTRPGKCPRCRGTHIEVPRFQLR
ncbi:MAG TPA: transcriptional regulator [Desulfobacterales bacterium]|jgi:transcriptional regulator|nr:transcriptional regulator [Desulfobacterales bacterium]